MVVGQKVVCIDDKTTPDVRVLYDNWIKEGTTYVVREVFMGNNPKGEWGEVGVTLLGLHNRTIPPGRELGFNSERFRPIEERPVEKVEELVQFK